MAYDEITTGIFTEHVTPPVDYGYTARGAISCQIVGDVLRDVGEPLYCAHRVSEAPQSWVLLTAAPSSNEPALRYSPVVTDTYSIRFAPFEWDDDRVESDVASWMADAATRLFAQQALPENWDSYGAVPVSPQHAAAAWRFLERHMSGGLPLPDFIPLADGGIQLEWDLDGVRVTYTTDDDEDPTVWLTTSTEDREVASGEVAAVFDHLRRLSRRSAA